jgi:hypothetical protein
MFLKYRPNTAYPTPTIIRTATTPIDTHSPIDAATLRLGLDCDVEEVTTVDTGDAESDTDDAIVVRRVEVVEGIKARDSTDDFPSSSVGILMAVGSTTVEVGDGALNDVRASLSIIVSTTSGD